MFWDAFMAKLGWFMGEVFLYFCLFGVIILILVLVALKDAWKQWRCPHHDQWVHETMACHARCWKCGKDLGFIGDYRAKMVAKREAELQQG